MPTFGYITIEDYDGEKSVVRVNLQDVDALNYGSVTQDLDELKDAIAPVIRGEVRKVSLRKEFPESAALVTDLEAQRESKWLVVMRDTTQFLDVANAVANTGFNKLFTIEIPTALLTGKLDSSGKNVADLTETDMAALVSSLEADLRSPWNHSSEVGITPTQEVVEIRHVGRNI